MAISDIRFSSMPLLKFLRSDLRDVYFALFLLQYHGDDYVYCYREVEIFSFVWGYTVRLTSIGALVAEYRRYH